MYVIGRSKGDYIRLVNSKGIEYSHSINLASIFTSLEKAELMIGYIKENIDSLYFANATILGNIIDKEKKFDKVTYVNKLKIYELVPTEVSIYEDQASPELISSFDFDGMQRQTVFDSFL